MPRIIEGAALSRLRNHRRSMTARPMPPRRSLTLANSADPQRAIEGSARRAMPESRRPRATSSRSSMPTRAPMPTGSITSSKPSRVAARPPRVGRTSRRPITTVRYAHAPGIPREVRGDGDELTQLCGCNMAITKAALQEVGGFDTSFTAAGDDVDLSWRLADLPEEKRAPLVDAPGAVVIHRAPRDASAITFASSAAMAPARASSTKSILFVPRSASGFMAARARGCRRCSAVRASIMAHSGAGCFNPCMRAPICRGWRSCRKPSNGFAASVILAMAGALSPLLGTLGCLGIIIWIATAILSAIFADADGRKIPTSDARHPRDAVSPRTAGAELRARARALFARARGG